MLFNVSKKNMYVRYDEYIVFVNFISVKQTASY